MSNEPAGNGECSVVIVVTKIRSHVACGDCGSHACPGRSLLLQKEIQIAPHDKVRRKSEAKGGAPAMNQELLQNAKRESAPTRRADSRFAFCKSSWLKAGHLP